MGVITPLATDRGPPCRKLQGQETRNLKEKIRNSEPIERIWDTVLFGGHPSHGFSSLTFVSKKNSVQRGESYHHFDQTKELNNIASVPLSTRLNKSLPT